ncbi:hypothetical protein BB560_000316 [Smittium megazygosporum]|uniref:Yeast cell wall synthesis Kre9/Knh1-like N-terminal domain-containing protein n=1 Tax=Smittium megazygosporum TaxID=133381 RepID=A0A2T9ZKQ0_9FUNG|nr:hypothetical protein BB560_000316 [Smittium megazygosporum]
MGTLQTVEWTASSKNELSGKVTINIREIVNGELDDPKLLAKNVSFDSGSASVLIPSDLSPNSGYVIQIYGKGGNINEMSEEIGISADSSAITTTKDSEGSNKRVVRITSTVTVTPERRSTTATDLDDETDEEMFEESTIEVTEMITISGSTTLSGTPDRLNPAIPLYVVLIFAFLAL